MEEGGIEIGSIAAREDESALICWNERRIRAHGGCERLGKRRGAPRGEPRPKRGAERGGGECAIREELPPHDGGNLRGELEPVGGEPALAAEVVEVPGAGEPLGETF